MKTRKIITLITIILLIAIISGASFFGIYRLKEYKLKNIVPKYSLGMEFTNSRLVNLEPSEEENLTKENYEKSKAIVQNRLEKLGAEQYTIKQDINTGKMQIQIAENDNTDEIIQTLEEKGTIEIKDNETQEVLIDNSKFKSANVVYGQGENNEYILYLQVKFNKEGQAKLEEISKIYVQTTSQVTNEKGETEDVTESKKVDVVINGETLTSTSFGQTMDTGILNVPITSTSDTNKLQEYMKELNKIAINLNSGTLPISYEETANLKIESNISNEKIEIYFYIAIAIIVIASVYIVINLKQKGILAIILNIGYVALLLLALRYTNIKITLEGIGGIIISTILNYIYIYKAFSNINKNFMKETTLKFAIRMIPIYLIAIVFTFNKILNVASLGMTMVWGIITMYLYNLTLTQIAINLVIKEEGNVKK